MHGPACITLAITEESFSLLLILQLCSFAVYSCKACTSYFYVALIHDDIALILHFFRLQATYLINYAYITHMYIKDI